MKRAVRVMALLGLLGAAVVGGFFAWYRWTDQAPAMAPPVDVQRELGLQTQSVPSSGTYAMVYVRENSPLALAGIPVMGDRERKFSMNPATKALFLGLTGEPSIDTAVVIVQETLVGDFLLDSQVVVSTRLPARLTIGPVSMKGQYVGGAQAGKVRDMVQNELRLLGDVTATPLPDGTLRVGFGTETKELAPGTHWEIARTLTSGGGSGSSQLIIHYYGAWPLRNITYLR